MSFEILIPNSVKRDLKKLDKQTLVEIKDIIFSKIAHSPLNNQILKGFKGVYVYKTRILHTDYRIAFKIDSKTKIVRLLLIKSRENFYKNLGSRID